MTCQHKACKKYKTPIQRAKGISPTGWIHSIGMNYCHWAKPKK